MIQSSISGRRGISQACYNAAANRQILYSLACNPVNAVCSVGGLPAANTDIGGSCHGYRNTAVNIDTNTTSLYPPPWAFTHPAQVTGQTGVKAGYQDSPVCGFGASYHNKSHFMLFRVVKTTLSSNYNISGLIPVCWLLFQCF